MAGDAQASFRDAAGRESVADLAAVSAEMLVAGRPWRVFRWRQGQAHYSGWYWSATTGGHVVYESRLELARLLLADFDPRVTAIAAQPFLVTASAGGRVRRHVPDFLLVHGNGAVDQIVYSHEAGMSKPDPRIYALTCARLGVRPQETVFLDDAGRCVAGAREAGIHAVRYQDNAQAIEEIEKLLTTP